MDLAIGLPPCGPGRPEGLISAAPASFIDSYSVPTLYVFVYTFYVFFSVLWYYGESNASVGRDVMERLRELREQQHLTLRELEHLSGVSKDAISEIERGLRHPRSITLKKLADGLGVSVPVLQGTVSHGTIGAYTAIYEPGENGWVVASCPDVPGTITQGRTIEEARDNLKDAIRLMREVMREDAEKDLEGREILREVIEV